MLNEPARHYSVDPKIATDLFRVDVLPLVSESRAPGRNFQLGYLRQPIDQRLCKPVRKIFCVGIRISVLKRQHSDRGDRRGSGGRANFKIPETKATNCDEGNDQTGNYRSAM